MGDLVLMSPFLRELRLSNPEAHITLVVDPQFANLVELCPHVNELLAFDHHYSGRIGRLALHGRALQLARAKLWPRRFDLALSPRWDTDYYHSAFVSYFSGAAQRIAYSENVFAGKQQLNRDFDSLFTRTLDDRAPRHEVERNLDFLRTLGGAPKSDHLELWLSEEDRKAARDALASRGFSSNDLLVSLAPGSGHPKRIWPLGRFITLGHFLHREFGARLLVVGGGEDRDRAARLQEEIGRAAMDFAGQMTLRQTAALLEHAQLVVANDSGPMHVAAAAGAAVVEISCHPVTGDPNHANSPVRFRPWTSDYAVLQPAEAVHPCNSACEWYDAHCILGVQVEEVEEAARVLLARIRPARPPRAGALK
jgi:heptosyltransferase-2